MAQPRKETGQQLALLLSNHRSKQLVVTNMRCLDYARPAAVRWCAAVDTQMLSHAGSLGARGGCVLVSRAAQHICLLPQSGMEVARHSLHLCRQTHRPVCTAGREPCGRPQAKRPQGNIAWLPVPWSTRLKAACCCSLPGVLLPRCGWVSLEHVAAHGHRHSASQPGGSSTGGRDRKQKGAASARCSKSTWQRAGTENNMLAEPHQKTHPPCHMYSFAMPGPERHLGVRRLVCWAHTMRLSFEFEFDPQIKSSVWLLLQQ